MAAAGAARTETALGTRLVAGAVGGLTGGVVFGMLMQMMDMMPMVAMLVGSSAVAVGWLVHLVISLVLGAAFALVTGPWLARLAAATGLGVIYGVVWWVLGALTIMPARLGMDLFMINTTAWQSLMGHVIYGAILGAVAAVVAARSRPTR